MCASASCLQAVDEILGNKPEVQLLSVSESSTSASLSLPAHQTASSTKMPRKCRPPTRRNDDILQQMMVASEKKMLKKMDMKKKLLDKSY